MFEISEYRCIICERNKNSQSSKPIIVGKGKRVCRECSLKIARVQQTVEGSPSADLLSVREEGPKVAGDMNGGGVLTGLKGRLSPKEIKAALDKYVVGQEEAKRAISIASYNHMKRSLMNDRTIQKSNILLLGPTGCGKTHLVETLGKIMNVPVLITPATNLTEAGYVGRDAETIVADLLNIADGNVDLAEKGIIFIDEIDKLVSDVKRGSRKEVGGTGVQQALLPIIEGTKVRVPLQGQAIQIGMQSVMVTVDTSNILFICGGAFPALEKIIKKRMVPSSIGFSSGGEAVGEVFDEEHIMAHVTTDDLQEFGLIPEFIGRIPVRVALENLSVETLRRIMTEPEDSIVSQYRKLFAFDGISLLFEDAALDYLAEKAKQYKTGARALREVLEMALAEVMYTAPSEGDIEQVSITLEYVKGCAPVQVIKRRRAKLSSLSG